MKANYLILSSLFAIFTSCSERQAVDGWYFITDNQTMDFDKSPIVTVTDFETVRLDSTPGSDNTMNYVITGQIKAEKFKTWADATEKAIGKRIGFLYNGTIITAPQVRARIEGGNFQISPQELCKNREKMFAVYEALKRND